DRQPAHRRFGIQLTADAGRLRTRPHALRVHAGPQHLRALHRAQIPGAVRIMAVETAPGTFVGPAASAPGPGAATNAKIKKSIARRYAAERRFRIYGVLAIVFGLVFLAVLFGSILSTGYTAFVQSSFKLNVQLDRSVIDPSGQRDRNALLAADYTLLARRSLASALGADPQDRKQMREIGALLSRDVD